MSITMSKITQVLQPVKKYGGKAIRNTAHYGGRTIGTVAGGGFSVFGWFTKGCANLLQKLAKRVDKLGNAEVIAGRKLTGKALGEKLSNIFNKDIIFKKLASFTQNSKATQVAKTIIA
ncbi:MAG: hypothetical protein AB1782_17345 [Cyanobacteriota bacterium]